MRRPRSLRSTLLWWLLIALAVVMPVRAGMQYLDILNETNAAFDRGLADAALALSNLVHVEQGRVRVAVSPETEAALRADETDIDYIAVLDAQRRVLWGDSGLSDPSLTRVGGLNSLAGVTVYQTHINGRPVRVVGRRFDCGRGVCEALAGETLNKRIYIEQRAMRSTVLFFLLLIVTLGVAVWLVVTRALTPLSTLSNEVSRRSLEDLSPLEPGDVPAEMSGLIDSVNQLFARLKQAVEAQAVFLTDAAHQLRTPLTSLRTEAELALLENAQTSARPALERIRTSAERASRLASQLLSQAREEARQQGPAHFEPHDLKATAEEAASEWVPQALRRGVDLGFQLDSAPVSAQPYALQEALSNLIHNALEYGAPPDGGEARITVRTHSDERWSVLEVEDNGCGIEPAERARVLERFQRGRQAQPGGSGLGLAIVRDIAAHHGGHIELADATDCTSEPRGLCARVILPRRAA